MSDGTIFAHQAHKNDFLVSMTKKNYYLCHPKRNAEILCKASAEDLFYAGPQPKLAVYEINAEVAQLVEHQLPKLRVAGSIPVFRSRNQAVTEM